MKELKGYCPVEKKDKKILVPVFDASTKLVGRIECDYNLQPPYCTEEKCPILAQNGYHQ